MDELFLLGFPSSLWVLLQVYKDDLPQLKQQSQEKNELAGLLRRQKAPEEGLSLKFVHG